MHRGFETRHDHISNQRQPHNQSFQQQQEHQVYHEPTRAYQPQEGRGQSSSRSGVGSFTFSDHPYPPYPPATTPKDETVPSNNLHSIRERLSKVFLLILLCLALHINISIYICVGGCF